MHGRHAAADVADGAAANACGAWLRIDEAAATRRIREAAGRGSPKDRYLALCSIAIRRADLALLARASGQPAASCDAATATAERAWRDVRRAVDVWLGGGRGDLPDRAEPAVLLTGDLGAWHSLVDSVLVVGTPECCGYDLADVELCERDAGEFARTCAADARMALVGIRGGGGVLAPLWASALSRALERRVGFSTVRPIGDPPRRRGYEDVEIADVARGERPFDHLVIVDDLPNSGDTIAQLAIRLRPHARTLWSASVGRVAELSSVGRPMPTVATAPALRANPRRLWEMLRPGDHAGFMRRLTAQWPEVLIPEGATLAIRCPSLQARYGRRTPWLPWNDPALAGERRCLVNPRKTPLLLHDADGTPLFHLRFVGEGPYGRAEHARVATLGAGGGASATIDGYRVAAHVPGLVPLADALHAADGAARRVLLGRCADLVAAMLSEPLAEVCRASFERPIGHSIREAVASLADRFGTDAAIPDTVAWAGDVRSPPYGASRRPIRSSLRYASGAWHWQVDRAGGVHRFHLEAGWGGVTWPELEVASFALEQRLTAADLRLIAARVGLAESAPRSIGDALAAASALFLQTRRREVREVDAAGRDRLRSDIAAMWETLARLAEPGSAFGARDG